MRQIEQPERTTPQGSQVMLLGLETRKVLPMQALQNEALEQVAQFDWQRWQRLLASLYCPLGQGIEVTRSSSAE